MKDTLIKYQGGGYDGCIWEWNYALFDVVGKFHDIYSSGVYRCDTEVKLLRKLIDEPSEVYTYRLPYDYQQFISEHVDNAGAIVKMTQILNKEYGYNLYFLCDKCGNEVGSGGTSTDYIGIGGIATMDTTKLCVDCYFEDCCAYCGEHETDGVFSDNGYCENCAGEDNEMPSYTCKDDYDEASLVEGRDYKVFKTVYKDEDTGERMLDVIDEQDWVLAVPVKCFNVPYEILNPKQTNITERI